MAAVGAGDQTIGQLLNKKPTHGQNEVCRLKTTIMIVAITATADLETGQAQEQCHTGLPKTDARRQQAGSQGETDK